MAQRQDYAVEAVIRYGVHAIMWLMWLTAGFAIWCAILARTSLAYAAALFMRLVSGAETRGIEASLDYAVQFWMDGFHRLRAARLRQPEQPNSLPRLDLKRFICEALYTLAFLAITMWARNEIAAAVSFLFHLPQLAWNALHWFFFAQRNEMLDGIPPPNAELAFSLPDWLPHRPLFAGAIKFFIAFLLLPSICFYTIDVTIRTLRDRRSARATE